MAVVFGPTFGAELAAAGCDQAVATWGSDGTLSYVPSATAAQTAAVQKVVAAHDPTRTLPRSASAKQVRYALNDLGVRTAWNAAVAASDQGCQDYWTSADPMFEINGKLAKLCTAAGITPKALFDNAVAQ